MNRSHPVRRKQGAKVAAKGIFQGLPWWVTWIAVPVLVLAVFGGLIMSVVGFVIGLLFKALLLVALIGGLIYVVRKFTSSSRSDW
ncbi:DUF5326 family protein [Streptomyces botrytidirepellens]|uniref:Integral membrane protein n=1 Tax=Streptomyces botrytidirepellens TaxID=2486417 RepID=A0A3M8TM18_9ACTN|nr:DUF5326 family protein [Streptomyces botrytidirepellens]RNF93136.1 hypothetical protein EEJ42_39075 [Streptomyces botrytidirepellens]